MPDTHNASSVASPLVLKIERQLVTIEQPFTMWLDCRDQTVLLKVSPKTEWGLSKAEIDRFIEKIEPEIRTFLSQDRRVPGYDGFEAGSWFKICILGRRFSVHLFENPIASGDLEVNFVEEEPRTLKEGILERIYLRSRRAMRFVDLRIVAIELQRLQAQGIDSVQLLRSDIDFIKYISRFIDFSDINDACARFYEEILGENHGGQFKFVNQFEHYMNVANSISNIFVNESQEAYVGKVLDRYGNVRSISFSILPVEDSDRNLEGQLVIYDDWTNRLEQSSDDHYRLNSSNLRFGKVDTLEIDCTDMIAELSRLGVETVDQVDDFVLSQKEEALKVCKYVAEYGVEGENSDIFKIAFGDKYNYKDYGTLPHLLRTAQSLKFVLGGEFGESQQVEYVGPGGEIIVASVSFRALHRENGKATRVLMVISDLTSQVDHANSSLKLAETFENLFESAPIGLLQVDFSPLTAYCQETFHGEIELARQALQELTIPENILKQCTVNRANASYRKTRREIEIPGSIWQYSNELGMKGMARTCNIYSHLLSTREVKGIEVKSVVDGIQRTLIAGASVLSRDGVWPREVLYSIQDVTKKAEAERISVQAVARYASLFESSPMAQFELDMGQFAIRIFDEVGSDPENIDQTLLTNEELKELYMASEFLLMNQQAREMFGQVSFQEFLKLIGRSGNENLEILDFSYRSMAKEGFYIRNNIELTTIDGVERVLNLQCTPLEWIGMWPSVVLISMTDVTDETSAYRALEDLTQDLERQVEMRTEALSTINKNLSSFAYTVSHDLQSPLRSLSSRLNSLKSKYLDSNEVPDKDKFSFELNKSIRQVNDLGEMILALLKLSAIGPDRLERKRVDLDEGLDQIVASVFEEHQIKIKKEPPGFGYWWCDRRLIQSVWQNLIDNALKYRSPDRELELVLKSWEDNGGKWFSITDNGIGIEHKNLERIFVAFERIHGGAGFGVGLSSVKRICEVHGGRIEAESEVGVGTTIRFWLPPVNS